MLPPANQMHAQTALLCMYSTPLLSSFQTVSQHKDGMKEAAGARDVFFVLFLLSVPVSGGD